MIEVRFSPDDLSRVRFAHSPLAELVASSWALRKPAKYWMHRPWRERAERLLPGAGLEPLLAVLRSANGYVPDFLTPIGVAPNLAAELRAVAGTDPSVVRRQLDRAGAPRLTPDELVAQLRRYFTLLIAPDWPRLRALALADIRRRTLLAAEQGGRTLLRELHPLIRWDGAALRVAVGSAPRRVWTDAGGRCCPPRSPARRCTRSWKATPGPPSAIRPPGWVGCGPRRRPARRWAPCSAGRGRRRCPCSTRR
ncbi:hypothetical protein [Micromonospora tarensis]|uniref:hypothetical protein n=1 Tax=Micromonospora tarensis TaxID=2806100 RepID=UPI001EE4560A|nr:hypothetical protein [Micromonospora tarensis]